MEKFNFFNIRFSLIIAVFLLAGSTLSAQWAVEIDDTQTPEELVQNVLLGAGVSVFNIEVTGAIPADELNQQFGEYIGPSNVISFNRGFIMTTGNVLGATGGPEGTNFNNNVQNDPDLVILSGGQNMNNCAIIEFDFIPNGDSLEFRYVFGSREYPSFTCTGFNDVFGFFISGPGIDGPFSDNAENIALIPDSDTPVGINSVNGGEPTGGGTVQNCLDANPNFVEDSIYFVNNQPPEDGDIEIPGLTTTLTAYADVICGETYHIKLAIGNALDQGLQSYVFIESESFASNSAVQVNLEIPIGINDSTLYRGCGEALLQFIRPLASSGVEEVAYLEVGGTAVNGVDVLPVLPDSVVFPVGVDTVSFVLTAPFLGTAMGEQTFDVVITNIASECAGAELTSSFRFYINDAEPLAIEPGGNFELADCNDSVDLIPVVTGGYGEYQYSWSNGATADSINVSPGFTTNYFLTVSDTCNAGSVQTSFNVQVPQYPPIIIDVVDEIVLDVCDEPITIVPEIEGGFGNYTVQWRDVPTNQIVGNAAVLNYEVPNTTTLRILVTDECGATANADVEVIVPPVEVFAFLPDGYSVNSCLEGFLLPAISEGGIGAITYKWYVNGELRDQTAEQFFVYDASMGQDVVVIAEDECGNFGTDSTTVIFDFPAIQVTEIPGDTSICKRTGVELKVIPSAGSGNFRVEWLQSGLISDTLYVTPPQTSRYDYMITDTCGTEYFGNMRVEVREVIASFEYDPTQEYYGLQMRNLSRPLLESEFFWDFGDGHSSTEMNPAHQFNGTDRYTITLTAIDDFGCEDVFTRTTIPPAEIFIPNAFTPDGDGINELWKVQGSNISEFEIWIFDRWGKQVFHSTDMNQGWNGSHDDGSHHNNMTLYNFFIRYKGQVEEDTFERTGSITVIR